MKKHLVAATIPFLLSLILFTSCRFQDNARRTQMPTKDVDKVSVSEAFKDADSVLGKTIGGLTLPENIDIPEYDGLYKITLVLNRAYGDVGDVEAKAKECFKYFYGNGYKESQVTYEWDENLNLDCYYYNRKENLSEKKQVLPEASYMWGTFDYWAGTVSDPRSLPEKANFINRTKIKDDTMDKTVKIGDDDVKISDLVKRQEEILEVCSDDKIDKDLEVIPVYVIEYNDEYVGKSVQVEYGMSYKGLLFDYQQSPFSEDKDDTTIWYRYSYINTFFDKCGIKTCEYDPVGDKIQDVEKCDEIISLGEAVDILKNELSPTLEFNITDIQLRYSCKNVQKKIEGGNEDPDNLETELEEFKKPAVFTPTWCFICGNEGVFDDYYILRVDATTGEITLDADFNTLQALGVQNQ